MIRYIKFSFLVFITFFQLDAQQLKPAVWSVNLSDEHVKTGDTTTIVFEVAIDKKWYLYSNDFSQELGPKVTEFEYQPDESYSLVGGTLPIGAKRKYDDLWEGEYTYFKGNARFEQKIVVEREPLNVTGLYDYQVCTDEEGKCIPFYEEFALSGSNETAIDVKGEAVKTEYPNLKYESFFSESFDFTQSKDLWGFLLLSFLAGLAALLTPCVFPMIPMTVSFFTKSGESKSGVLKSTAYGLFIVLIYTLIGAVLAPFMGPDTANHLATEWLPNIIFFSVFIVFALSFFGLFEITLPHGFINKMDQNSERKGLIGVFFMAFTLVLVSFSCTGPIVGTILVESAGGVSAKPILGMLAFSLAFAIPFTIFAFFPSLMSSLPKSGGWLNSVKVVLGFVELALAFKFLSIADQAFHWGILDREINIAIWIAIFGLMGFYLLGKLRLPNDSELKVISVPRLMLSLVTFSFVIYLIPGLFGAPLKALSGYLPPKHTLDFDLVNDQVTSSITSTCDTEVKYGQFLHLPHGMQGYFDYNQALACARAQGKPLFIDFTGHGCTNCREMEAVVWSDPQVLSRLNEEFVVVALYVDDKTELSEDQWYVSSYDGRIKKTIGRQNADFEIQKTGNPAQPFYVIIDNQEKPLVMPMAYNLNVDTFVKFLDESLTNFKSGKSPEI